MQSEIIVAMIGAVPALITAIVSVSLGNRVLEVKLNALQSQFNKLDQKVTAHNNFMERIAVLERDDKTAFNELKEVKGDINKLQDHMLKQS